jgi:hypothetical protein
MQQDFFLAWSLGAHIPYPPLSYLGGWGFGLPHPSPQVSSCLGPHATMSKAPTLLWHGVIMSWVACHHFLDLMCLVWVFE